MSRRNDEMCIESYLDQHIELVSLDCDERGARAVAGELASRLGLELSSVVAVMTDRMFIMPSTAAMYGLEAA